MPFTKSNKKTKLLCIKFIALELVCEQQNRCPMSSYPKDSRSTKKDSLLVYPDSWNTRQTRWLQNIKYKELKNHYVHLCKALGSHRWAAVRRGNALNTAAAVNYCVECEHSGATWLVSGLAGTVPHQIDWSIKVTWGDVFKRIGVRKKAVLWPTSDVCPKDWTAILLLVYKLHLQLVSKYLKGDHIEARALNLSFLANQFQV